MKKSMDPRAFPAATKIGKVWIETLQIDVECGLSKQANDKPYFVLKTPLHKTLDTEPSYSNESYDSELHKPLDGFQNALHNKHILGRSYY